MTVSPWLGTASGQQQGLLTTAGDAWGDWGLLGVLDPSLGSAPWSGVTQEVL